jgi:hypothetical protein
LLAEFNDVYDFLNRTNLGTQPLAGDMKVGVVRDSVARHDSVLSPADEMDDTLLDALVTAILIGKMRLAVL